MRLPRLWFVVLALSLGSASSSLFAQSKAPRNDGEKPAAKAATEEEVEQLRREVRELRAVIQKMLEVSGQANADGSYKLVTTAAVVPSPPSENPVSAPTPEASVQGASASAQKSNSAPTSGWNGEHFFIKSADGAFQIQPYGYVQTDFLSYMGAGAPPDTFSVRRGRFGFQGNYGDHYQFGLLIDAAASTGATIRDIYLNAKATNWFQIQGGQFKEPFAQEELQGDTNLDFVDRGLQGLLYPSAASTNRSPGVTIHGDIHDGALQYWAGAFNGKGYSTNNTTSVPEAVGRVRFYPWRSNKDSVLHEFAIGGSIAYSMSRGLSNELTAPMTMPDAAYTWFPQFPVNGNVWRYEGEITYLKGPWGFRDEYVQASYDRTGVGTLVLGGLGFANLPNVRYQAWDSAATYLLTKERQPENGTPRVNHPVFGPETAGGGKRGWGAWELAFRYSGVQGNEPGIFFNNIYTPQLVPTYDKHTDQFSVGVNWYLNYWVKFQSNVDIDQLKQPSTIGAVPQNYLVFEQRLQYRF
jgi:phosphate-selective porin